MSYDLFRFALEETDDGGDLQRVKGAGLAGEQLTGVHRVQPFGFHSNAPAGSHGIGLALHGKRDLVTLLGAEHPQYRPRSREVGSTAIYDMHGNIISLVQAEARFVHAQKVVLVVGGVSMEITADGVNFTGGTIKHDGKSIDKNHIHGGVVPGAATTAVPAN